MSQCICAIPFWKSSLDSFLKELRECWIRPADFQALALWTVRLQIELTVERQTERRLYTLADFLKPGLLRPPFLTQVSAQLLRIVPSVFGLRASPG